MLMLNSFFLWTAVIKKTFGGAGLDLETNEMDFDSLINLRPALKNTSREILDQKVREKVEAITRSLLLE